MEEITYAEVLKYLPRFEAGEFANAKAHYQETGREPPLVLDFMSALIHSGLQVPFDWPSWKKEARQYFENPEIIKGVDLETIQKLVTTFIRQDRFSGGHFASLCSAGIFVHILRRLHALSIEQPYEN